MQFKKKDESKDDGSLPYSYGFFHFVFALGAMYLAMLFVGWNLHQTMHKYGHFLLSICFCAYSNLFYIS